MSDAESEPEYEEGPVDEGEILYDSAAEDEDSEQERVRYAVFGILPGLHGLVQPMWRTVGEENFGFRFFGYPLQTVERVMEYFAFAIENPEHVVQFVHQPPDFYSRRVGQRLPGGEMIVHDLLPYVTDAAAQNKLVDL